MARHVVLDLLAQESDPSHGSIQSAAGALAIDPWSLSVLAREDLFEPLLSLLMTKARRFERLLLALDHRIKDKPKFCMNITPLIQKLLGPDGDILDRAAFHDLLCAALPLCSAPQDQWKILRDLAANNETLEVLTVEPKGHSMLLKWIMTFSQHDPDVEVLNEWAGRLVTLIECCPDQHEISTTLARWRTIVSLEQILQKQVQAGHNLIGTDHKLQSPEQDALSTDLGYAVLEQLSEFGLPTPRSSRMCSSHLDALRLEKFSTFKEIVASYPCQTCRKRLRHVRVLPEIRANLANGEDEPQIAGNVPFLFAKGLGDWEVILSSRAYLNLQSLASNTQLMKTLRSKIVELASGKPKFEEVTCRSGAPRVHLKTTKWCSDTIFLWQISTTVGPGPDQEQQAVKVWAVGTHEMIQNTIDEVKRHQNGLSEDCVRNCCEEGPLVRGKRLPKIYPCVENARKLRTQAILDIRIVDQESFDTFNKSYRVTEDLVQSIIDGDPNAEFIFDLSPTEQRIIQHFQTPTLVLGRSGTGKTTCLVFKMVLKYLASCETSPQRPARQVLLTRSVTLAEKLRSYTDRLIRTLSKKGSKLRSPNVSDVSSQRTLFDLVEDDWPLVCTWEHFLGLLGNTIHSLDRKAFPRLPGESVQDNLVNFKTFYSKYWCHLPLELVRGIPCELVFSEIMGIIKGSFHACKNLSYLQAQEYQDISDRVAPIITSKEDRTKVYQVFEKYESLKQQAGDLDIIDWVVQLLRQVRSNTNTKARLASCIQEIYVDEVQDLQCVDLALLLELGCDPRGFHFGGDTAQTITPGSHFRFEELKDLLYYYFSHVTASVSQKRIVEPQMFTLSHNYRSHQGILSLASSVMEWLCQTFPRTIDKLEPEVGSLKGPIPILFLNCDTSVLVRSEDEASTLPDHELLFGAEQVILARDDMAKARLVGKLGETALVLTILQAKGMEFDDVILWGFLSSSPNPAGWRSLQKSAPENFKNFDATKHAALCSELKHLYVSITRARVRFLMIESSEDIPQSFIKLTTTGSGPAMLEVVSAASDSFNEKIKSLKPRRSDDPRRWCANGEDMMARGYYAEACLCFRRAAEPLKEKRAAAHLKELHGEDFKAKGDETNAHEAFEAAAIAFKELNLTFDATRLLIRLQRHVEAAELWFKDAAFTKAALLFEQASKYERAADSWHCDQESNKAVLCLRAGVLYDKMIIYIHKNKERLSKQDFSRHQRAIKVLLRQQNISEEHRRTAIELLGSIDEQEAFFLEYEMYEGLRGLYKDQKLVTKLLSLLVKLECLEEALDLASSLPCRGESVLGKAQLSKLASIIWIDRISSESPSPSSISLGEDESLPWQRAYAILGARDTSDTEKAILSMDNDGSLHVVKAFLCLYVSVHMERAIAVSKIGDIPLDLLWNTLRMMKTQLSEPRGVVGEAVLLFCGVHRSFTSSQHYTTRPWSPLRKTDSTVPDLQSLPEAALSWTFEKLSHAVIRVSELARQLFQTQWPIRCSFFLVTGDCGSRKKTSGCPYHHEPVTGSTPTEYLHELLAMNKVLCESNALYHRRIMPEEISKTFLGTRRYWLEKLIAALSFVSAFEQDSIVQQRFVQELRTKEALKAVTSSLEDHLFYRVRSQWGTNASLDYVLEQLNLAAHLGGNVKKQLIRRTTQPLRRQHPFTHAALFQLAQLENRAAGGSPFDFLNGLQNYLRGPQGIMNLPWNAFEVFHCHTAMFEETALYLLLQIAQSSIMVPRSWLDLHLPSILSRKSSLDTPTFDQRSIYRDALVVLLRAFIELLQFINTPLQTGKGFFLCGRPYPSRMLQQRNCEVLAIIMVNLVAIPSLCLPDLKTHWEAVVRVFGLPSTKASDLTHDVGNSLELRKKLLKSHANYQGRNPLTILNILDGIPHPFAAFRKEHKLVNQSLSALRKTLVPTQASNIVTAPDSTTDNDMEQAAATDKDAAQRIWRFWTANNDQLRKRKAFANTEGGRLISNFQAMGNGSPFTIRYVLLYRGPEALRLLDSLDSSVSVLKKRALNTLDVAGIESSEALDTVLEAVSKLGLRLEQHHERLSEESLSSVVRGQDHNLLKDFLENEIVPMRTGKKEVANLNKILDRVAKGNE